MKEQTIDANNLIFKKAVAFVNQTNQNLFLTGKAGTGKTTFLKYIRENCYKKMAITAPTGVAAMNAGGTTLHALFWLPFGVFLEDYELKWDEKDNNIYNKNRLFSTIKLTKQRRAILQELEMLVIDEVSMVRADTLDAIDVILKSVRRDMRPFGGVQVLFIGDLYQLPPVVRDQEWQILRNHYTSPFFFNAKVLRSTPLIKLELQHIYRQSDDKFISVLNNIRNNQCTQQDLEELNTHYKEDFVPDKSEQFITLTSHNRLADQINQEELAKLPGKMHNVKAVVKDDFQQGAYPTEETLTLKLGAQVMFIKNDTGEDRKYFNGKIGVVKELNLDKHQVVVGFKDGSEDVVVRRETWENIKYKYNKGEDKIEEEVLGTFSQFPLRLAWAITIHKSQGLTFDKAIIDAGTSFAAGQVYVALSRLTGLEGLVLRSKIAPHAIRTDFQVVDFMKQLVKEEEVDDILKNSQRAYLGQILLNSFRWTSLTEAVNEMEVSLKDRNIDNKEGVVSFFFLLQQSLQTQEKVAHKFMQQLHTMLSDKDALDYHKICERTTSAVNWFLPKMEEELLKATEKHIEDWSIRKRTKKYIQEMKALLLDFKRKYEILKHCLTIAEALTKEEVLDDLSLKMNVVKDDSVKVADDDTTEEKDTKQITLDMYQDGMDIAQIAQKRGMVEGTVYGHLIHYVGSEIEAEELIDLNKLDRILEVLKANEGQSSSQIKIILGEDYSYPEIKIGQKVLETKI
ncbi:helix-turn-helix domain-containing protein [Sphingobacterium litopenaei]|uniref:Helix-turn-helix domain-containing protein n=1 Tax=Sphingobacterium litopenaei TaxID=2763500 RepID=A0ABR7YIK8_9SPHI|nr:helix-turn-helix domain-containing protein [Sphingobacterium litopenaei]MBD1431038.1 helix-turn-helix domain-containing protein [Sphingobacterium litopenaei]